MAPDPTWQALHDAMLPFEEDLRCAQAEVESSGFRSWWPAWIAWPDASDTPAEAAPGQPDPIRVLLTRFLASAGSAGDGHGVLFEPELVARLCQVLNEQVLSGKVDGERSPSPWRDRAPALAGHLAPVTACRARVEAGASADGVAQDQTLRAFIVRLCWRVYSVRLVRISKDDDSEWVRDEVSWLLRRFCQGSPLYQDVLRMAARTSDFDVNAEIGARVDGKGSVEDVGTRRPAVDDWLTFARTIEQPQAFVSKMTKTGSAQILSHVFDRLQSHRLHYAASYPARGDDGDERPGETTGVERAIEQAGENAAHEGQSHLRSPEDDALGDSASVEDLIALGVAAGIAANEVALLVVVARLYHAAYVDREAKRTRSRSGKVQIGERVADWINGWRADEPLLDDWLATQFPGSPVEQGEVKRRLMTAFDHLFPPAAAVTPARVKERLRLIALRAATRLTFRTIDETALRLDPPAGDLVAILSPGDIVILRGKPEMIKNTRWVPVRLRESQRSGWIMLHDLEAAQDASIADA